MRATNLLPEREPTGADDAPVSVRCKKKNNDYYYDKTRVL